MRCEPADRATKLDGFGLGQVGDGGDVSARDEHEPAEHCAVVGVDDVAVPGAMDAVATRGGDRVASGDQVTGLAGCYGGASSAARLKRPRAVDYSPVLYGALPTLTASPLTRDLSQGKPDILSDAETGRAVPGGHRAQEFS